MIYLQLEQIGRDSDAIQYNKESIAAFFLWETWIEISNELQEFDGQPDVDRRRFFGPRDLFHLTNLAPAAIYLDTFLSYVDVDQGRVTERPGSEQAAKVASLCLLRALSGADPTSSVLEDIRKSYLAVIPLAANFEGLHRHHAINAIHAILVSSRLRRFFEWTGYQSSTREHTFIASTLVRLARKGKQHGKVPRWVLRFVIHSMPHDSQPPVSVIIDCLTIIAVDLGCDMSHAEASGLRGRYVNP